MAQSGFTSEWSRGLTPRRRLLIEIVRRLDDEEVEQMLFTDRICDLCGTPFMGILDEGKLRQPLPLCLGGKGLFQFYFGNPSTLTIGDVDIPRFVNETFIHPSTGETIRGQMTDYEICQSIVMTGLFSREQLGLSKLTNHELEVCERRYAEIRPARCDCDFGSPTEAEFDDFVSSTGKYGDLVPVNGLTAVEQSFVTGNPVRTGYRRRSVEAVRARRQRFRQKNRKNTVTCSTKPVSGFAFQDVGPETVELKFNFLPYGKSSRRYKAVAKQIRSIRSEVKVQKSVHKTVHYRLDRNLVVRPKIDPRPPKPDQRKYWYFRRKRGYYYHSLHHPYDDDIIPKGISRIYS